MKILLVGANSQLGKCLFEVFPQNWELVALNRQQLDITDALAVKQTIFNIIPDIIINTAAYTAVDKAEHEIALAENVNVIGVANLAKSAEELSIPLIHISTDYVFDGCGADDLLTEQSLTNPLNIYGKTKLQGELLAFNLCKQCIVIRTSWLFSKHGNSFVKTMLKLGLERDILRIVDDQFGCPTYAIDLAQCIVNIIEQGINTSALYHYSGHKKVSWYEFAKTIFLKASQFKPEYAKLKVIPVSSEEFVSAAQRPKNAPLNCQKIRNERGITPSDWHIALDEIIPSIINSTNS